MSHPMMNIPRVEFASERIVFEAWICLDMLDIFGYAGLLCLVGKWLYIFILTVCGVFGLRFG